MMVAWWTGVECRIEPISEVKDILRYYFERNFMNLIICLIFFIFIYVDFFKNKE